MRDEDSLQLTTERSGSGDGEHKAMKTQQMPIEPLPASDLFGLDVGPSYCEACGEWPASMTPKGKRCHMCWTRDIAAENPVPLPDDKQCLDDLARIGVPGAAEKLASRWPNDSGQPTAKE